jgi:hypothetical protein
MDPLSSQSLVTPQYEHEIEAALVQHTRLVQVDRFGVARPRIETPELWLRALAALSFCAALLLGGIGLVLGSLTLMVLVSPLLLVTGPGLLGVASAFSLERAAHPLAFEARQAVVSVRSSLEGEQLVREIRVEAPVNKLQELAMQSDAYFAGLAYIDRLEPTPEPLVIREYELVDPAADEALAQAARHRAQSEAIENALARGEYDYQPALPAAASVELHELLGSTSPQPQRALLTTVDRVPRFLTEVEARAMLPPQR